MADSWFRFYNSAVNDPKVQRLSSPLFRFWINLLCLASANRGTLPSVVDMEFSLRLSQKQVEGWLENLISAGLVDQTESGLEPHNWNIRQYKSDGSTERVKRFRERHGNVSETLHETGPDQTRPRADTESKKINGFVVGKKRAGNGAVTILDPAERLNRFQKWLAEKGGAGWISVTKAADPSHPEFAIELARCQERAKAAGKGWPKQWPA